MLIWGHSQHSKCIYYMWKQQNKVTKRKKNYIYGAGCICFLQNLIWLIQKLSIFSPILSQWFKNATTKRRLNFWENFPTILLFLSFPQISWEILLQFAWGFKSFSTLNFRHNPLAEACGTKSKIYLEWKNSRRDWGRIYIYNSVN